MQNANLQCPRITGWATVTVSKPVQQRVSQCKRQQTSATLYSLLISSQLRPCHVETQGFIDCRNRFFTPPSAQSLKPSTTTRTLVVDWRHFEFWVSKALCLYTFLVGFCNSLPWTGVKCCCEFNKEKEAWGLVSSWIEFPAVCGPTVGSRNDSSLYRIYIQRVLR